jgi:TnpA family transposase
MVAEVGDDVPTPDSLGGKSDISSGIPEEVDNEMKDYIQMRMREAETEAIQEYLMLKSGKDAFQLRLTLLLEIVWP